MNTQTNSNSEMQLKNKYSTKLTPRNLIFAGMFTAIICVMSQLSIQTQPIPFTLSLFAIFLTGALLPPKLALLSVLSYILLGAFGLPVFANSKGGFQVIIGMTGGYLMSYPIMAFLTALCYTHAKKAKTVALAAGMILGLLVCYIIGTLWFSYLTGNDFYKSLTICVFPFLLFDVLKIILAISISIPIKRTLFRQIML